MSLAGGHVRKVRMLYKVILRLHRGLPTDLKALGDSYVKEEFRHHKNAEPEFVPIFMKEWATYAVTMAKQLRQKSEGTKFGAPLSSRSMDNLRDEQVEQLYELYKETSKPMDPENPLGENPHMSKPMHPDT